MRQNPCGPASHLSGSDLGPLRSVLKERWVAATYPIHYASIAGICITGMPEKWAEFVAIALIALALALLLVCKEVYIHEHGFVLARFGMGMRRVRWDEVAHHERCSRSGDRADQITILTHAGRAHVIRWAAPLCELQRYLNTYASRSHAEHRAPSMRWEA